MSRSRFTLVELMIAITIVATLAALAIPTFADMQLRTQRAEVPLLTDGLRSAVGAYVMDHPDSTLSLPFNPDPTSLAGSVRPVDMAIGGDWAMFPDFTPDGAVFGTYGAEAFDGVTAFGIAGASNLDSDDVFYIHQLSVANGFTSEERTGCFWSVVPVLAKPMLQPPDCY